MLESILLPCHGSQETREISWLGLKDQQSLNVRCLGTCVWIPTEVNTFFSICEELYYLWTPCTKTCQRRAEGCWKGGEGAKSCRHTSTFLAFSASIGRKTGNAIDSHLCRQYWHLCLQSLFWSETEQMNGGSFESQCTQIGENMWSKDAILTLSVIPRSVVFSGARADEKKLLLQKCQYW